LVAERNLRALTEGPREMDPKADTPRETAKRFLEGGRIVEHGSHDNLMAQSRHYRQLHDLKLGRYDAGDLS
jgi:hypothetical protein